MRIFKSIRDLIEVATKWLPLIHQELKRQNDNAGQLSHVFAANMNDLKKVLEHQAANEAEFINVITHFFAFSKELKVEEAKRKALEAEDAKPGKHDDSF